MAYSPSLYSPTATTTLFSTSNHTLPPSFHLTRPFTPTPILRLYRCHVTTPTPPPPPPPPESESQPPSSPSGFSTTISRIQDTTQIFLAVLFWMSLFFWASAWDGRNGDKRSKGPRLRR
ncbi:hypothetical protein Leryth_003063 [Lithospermum erythrorhizon]|nr:hypothetical protein Leryth_003063 [Lithospermum erythrorhizon]